MLFVPKEGQKQRNTEDHFNRYREIVELQTDLICRSLPDGTITFVNNAYCQYYGKKCEEMIGTNYMAHLPFEDQKRDKEHLQKITRENPVRIIEHQTIAKDGSLRWQQWTDQAIFNKEGEIVEFQFVGRDITESKKKEELLQNLNRTLKALSDSNQAMLQAVDEKSYLENVCRIIVEDCGHAMAWVGFAENDENKSVRVVASAGKNDGYLDVINITWADTEKGQCSTGTAIRTGKSCGCQDISSDPRVVIWRDEALKRGYASSLALPLMNNGRTLGSITIYSFKKNAFTEDEIVLLSELAKDLSHGIASIRLRLAHQKAEEALAKERENLQTIFDVANVGMILIDEDGVVKRINKTISQWVGKNININNNDQPGDIIRCIYAISNPRGCGHKPECANCLIRSIFRSSLDFQQAIYNREVQATLEIGGKETLIWLDISVNPVFLNGKQHALISIRDITSRKLAEEEKNNFIAVMSHELRNPLTPIMAGSQLLLAHLENNEFYNQENYGTLSDSVKIIEQQARNMTHLLDDLLDITRISRGKIDLKKQKINLIDSLQSAVKAIQPFIDVQKHSLYISLPNYPIYINADPVRIEQIVINLLKNAVKFTPLNGSIWLKARQIDNEAEIVVRDNGIGIEAGKIDSIFDMFSSFNTPFVTTLGELGIGLKLVKDLVSMHNGTIIPKSEGPGKGSEFTIKFPALQEEFQPAIKDEKIPTKTKNKKRVLIVDDSISITKLISSAFSYLGHEVRVANDPRTALEVAKEYKPDVVLVDIGLPVMNGYELAQELRKIENETNQKIKLVALTGYGQDEDRRRSKEAGFDLHLIKPIDLKTLEEAIANI